MTAADPHRLLDVDGLEVTFRRPRSLLDVAMRRSAPGVHAVRGVSFTLRQHETLGLVGESGSGKTTLGRAILQLHRPSAGSIRYRGRAIHQPDREWQRQLRREIQMVFQDPYSSLNPRMTIGDTLAEVLRVHRIVPPDGVAREVDRLMSLVGLPANMASRTPRALSGGQRQRVGLARALAVRPVLLVLDEPVAALDVSIQAQILNLLDDLRGELGLTMIFVAHDLSVVKHVSDRVAVMYRGRIVETGTRGEIFAAPRHPYTRSLLDAVPRLVPRKRERRLVAASDAPTPEGATACPYAARCPLAEARCRQSAPALRAFSETGAVACHLAH
jgi:oligopeptide/dipeptide ABC transporter ATP-binding protein